MIREKIVLEQEGSSPNGFLIRDSTRQQQIVNDRNQQQQLEFGSIYTDPNYSVLLCSCLNNPTPSSNVEDFNLAYSKRQKAYSSRPRCLGDWME